MPRADTALHTVLLLCRSPPPRSSRLARLGRRKRSLRVSFLRRAPQALLVLTFLTEWPQNATARSPCYQSSSVLLFTSASFTACSAAGDGTRQERGETEQPDARRRCLRAGAHNTVLAPPSHEPATVKRTARAPSPGACTTCLRCAFGLAKLTLLTYCHFSLCPELRRTRLSPRRQRRGSSRGRKRPESPPGAARSSSPCKRRRKTCAPHPPTHPPGEPNLRAAASPNNTRPAPPSFLRLPPPPLFALPIASFLFSPPAGAHQGARGRER